MAKKLENDDIFNESDKPEALSSAVSKDSEPSSGGKKKKNKVVVINVPKKKKRLRTPSHILRITMVWCFAIAVYLLTFPFLNVTFYITKDLEVTPDYNEAYRVLADQKQIDTAEASLRKAKDALVLVPEDDDADEEQNSASQEETAKPEETSASDQNSKTEQESSSGENSGIITTDSSRPNVRAIETMSYQWTYHVADNVNIDKLSELLDEVKQLDRNSYTDESLEVLNNEILNAHKVLCASVNVNQNALQMMLGGTIGEAFGDYSQVGDIFLRGFLSTLLVIIPVVGALTCVIDKKRIIKNFIITIIIISALADIFIAIYPYIGIGAVLSVALYFLILLLNIMNFYARQQEKYIVDHPELEPEFTEKHPHFVKALINYRTFDAPNEKYKKAGSKQTDDKAESARNAKKRRTKKKKNKK